MLAKIHTFYTANLDSTNRPTMIYISSKLGTTVPSQNKKMTTSRVKHAGSRSGKLRSRQRAAEQRTARSLPEIGTMAERKRFSQ